MKPTKPLKNPRQTKILEIIRKRKIGTQEEIVDALKADGMDVTQATVSRDIKELGIIKVSTSGGDQKYTLLNQSGKAASGRMMKVFNEAVISIANSGTLVIIKTLPGMAQAAASAIDSMELESLLGTIAGDDTIFLATAGRQDSIKLKARLTGISSVDDLTSSRGMAHGPEPFDGSYAYDSYFYNDDEYDEEEHPDSADNEDDIFTGKN